IAQCPYPNCRKYLLLEDAVRGGTVSCLLCKQPIAVSNPAPGQPPSVMVEARTTGEAAAPPILHKRTQPCPQCGASLQSPAAGSAPQKVKCGQCGHVFQAG
ncbi:MAG TPA: hypothetical protein VGN42_21075, partial [Pirellulales bacterium]|nr:hypothetical protein [Pirellulales bacterium]